MSTKNEVSKTKQYPIPKKIEPRWYWKVLSQDGLLKDPENSWSYSLLFHELGYATEQQALDAFHKIRYEYNDPFVLLKMYESVVDMD